MHSAGSIQQFESSRVRIGRGSDCELRFDPHADRAVSALHAELVLEAGTLRIVDSGSRNGVFVNGVVVAGETTLASGDVIRLGGDGPQFEVEFGVEEAAELQTMQLDGAPPTMIRPGPSAPTPVAAGPVRQESAMPDRSTDGQSTGKKSVGLNTLMGVVDQTVRRERQRAKRVLVPIVAILTVTVLALLFWPTDEPLKWRDVLAEPISSVYVCAKLDAGNASPFGTAWSLGDGLLATNSHVAVEFEGLRAGQQFIVRSCSTPPQDIRIEKVTLHPAYTQWSRLSQKYDPYVAGQGFQRSLPPACDVALLHVHVDDVDLLAPGLTIASRSELLDIAPGDAMALVGYPMEGQAGKGVNMDAPYPQMRDGTVSRLTNYFLGRDDPIKRQLIGLSISSAGGASGSPVFNAQGKVVAINSAGDYLDVGIEGRRVRSGGAYGQRVDVLLDLIDGVVTEDDEQRSKELEAEFLKRFQKGVAEPDAFAYWLASQMLQKGENLGEQIKVEFEIATPGRPGAQVLNNFKTTSAGSYFRVVLPTLRPVPPVVATLNNGRYQPDKSIRYFLLDRWTLRAGTQLKTRVEVPKDTVIDTPLGYVCYWYPVKS